MSIYNSAASTQRTYRCPECGKRGFRQPGHDICVACCGTNWAAIVMRRESAINLYVHKRDYGGRSEAFVGLFSDAVQLG